MISGTGMSPFGRYPSTFGAPNPNFPGLSSFPPSREMPPLGGLGSVHDPWRGYAFKYFFYKKYINYLFFLLFSLGCKEPLLAFHQPQQCHGV